MQIILSSNSPWRHKPMAGISPWDRMYARTEESGLADRILIADAETVCIGDSPTLWIQGLFPLWRADDLQEIFRFLRGRNDICLLPTETPSGGGILYLPGSGIQDRSGSFETLATKARQLVSPCPLNAIETARDFVQAQEQFFHAKAEALLDAGILLMSPQQCWIETPVSVGGGTVIEPGVFLCGQTRIGREAHIRTGAVLNNVEVGDRVLIRPYVVLEDSSVAARATVGPFAHIRPGSVLDEDVRVGNFVEIKKARLGPGSKAGHLAYLGDAVIGRDCNIGAGTITCNYDGFNKNVTTLGDRVFIGSDSQLIAPVHLGDDSYVAAGSTITRDVPAQALAIARGRQTNKEGRAELLRNKAKIRSASGKP